MERQSNLVFEVLKRLSQAGILERILVVGSWAAYFYKHYFKSKDYYPILKTRDIDFLLPRPFKFHRKVDLEALLSDLGFEVEHSAGGSMRLENAELILEILIPEVGAGSDKPYAIPELNFNAQPLRHLSMLWRDPIEVEVEGVGLKLPHPADYVLHKMIIQERRKKKEKQEKDLQSALEVLEALLKAGGQAFLKQAFSRLSKNESREVCKVLKAFDKEEVYDFLIKKE